MSNTEDWTISAAHYEYAKQEAKKRAKKQWDKWMNDPKSINLWITYNRVQNTAWDNPWIEKELGGLYNGPSVPASPLAYEVTQNAYMEYCFWKWKGHARYSAIAMLTIDWNETRMAHGSWEYSNSRYMIAPYNASNNPNSLIGFDANRSAEGMASYTWFVNGAIVPSWTDTFFDESNHQTYSLTAPAGSWDAVKKRYIKTYTDDEGEHPVIEDGHLVFSHDIVNPNQLYAYEVVGYGIVQWTAFGRLVRHARSAFPGYGGDHWQYNGTLQLFVLDWERKTAMNTTPENQHLPTYQGEWVNSYATRAVFEHNGTQYHYPYSCTWDYWASDGPVTWCRNKCAELGITNAATIDEHCRQLMLDIMGACYLHSGYYRISFSNVRTQSRYFGGAIDYWDANGGFDVKDIPRPRDIPTTTELDQYHMNKATLVSAILTPTNKRRKRSCQLHIVSRI